MPGSPNRVYLHIGLPKTGTTSIQALLAENRPLLKKRGLLYPFVRQGAMFHGAVELLGWEQKFGVDPALARGTWQALCRRAVEFKGRGLISHEILGRCTEEQVAAALAPLGGAEVHVVVTARDIGRQLTAVYQERVKNGRTFTFEEFVGPVVARDPQRGGRKDPFWLEQDLTEVLRRWNTGVPADRMHVVTCPPAGAAHDVLLQRFGDAVGLDVAGLARPETRNTSLAAANVELLRRVNVELGDRLQRRAHLDVVKQWFGERLLAARPGRRLSAPESARARLESVTDRWLTEIPARGYQVHGDLDDLRPAGLAPDHETALSEDEVLGATPALLAELLAEVADLRRRLAE